MKIPIVLAVLVMLAGCSMPQYSPPTSSGAAYYPPPVVQAPVSPAGDLRTLLEGCSIIAEDGQMLGVITSNAYDTKSFLNEYGTYGSKYSSTSIWNEYGQYGGQYSSMSPFNSYTSTPPRIISPGGQVIGYLTVNKFKNPGISPYAIVALMK